MVTDRIERIWKIKVQTPVSELIKAIQPSVFPFVFLLCHHLARLPEGIKFLIFTSSKVPQYYTIGRLRGRREENKKNYALVTYFDFKLSFTKE